MAYRKIAAFGKKAARAIDAAMKDADLARTQAHDPEFQRRLQADRRGTLSRFKTVQHALSDRQRIERARQTKAR